VEALADGVLLYTADPKLSGSSSLSAQASREVEAWLRSRFSRVEVDSSPKPAF